MADHIKDASSAERRGRGGRGFPSSVYEDLDRIVLKFRPEGAGEARYELHYFCLQLFGELPRLVLEVTQTPCELRARIKHVLVHHAEMA
eukprot:12258-Hanusia_phi.AAC.1